MLIALPEILLLVFSLTALLLDLFFEKKVWLTATFSVISLLVILALLLFNVNETPSQAFSHSFVVDNFAVMLKVVVVLLSIATIFYSYYAMSSMQDNEVLKGEFFVILMLALLGFMILISAGSLVTLYLALELSSLSLYGLVAWHRKSAISTEAGVKYFVLGSVASGLLLYGFSMIYGVSGSFILEDIAIDLAKKNNIMLYLFGLMFVIVAVAFKLGIVPFHMWLPDVYQGAPTYVTMYLASASKVAMFAMLYRLWVETLNLASLNSQMMLIILSVASVVVGNILAIVQQDIKRMLAYSSIAHMGFVILGVLSATSYGISAALFYVIIYSIMSLAGFALLLILHSNNEKITNISDFQGLSKQQPLIAFLMLIIMFSMAGIPPTAGFYAKLSVLNALINAEFYYLAIIAVVMSVIGSFYYLRVIKVMYFDKASTNTIIIKNNLLSRLIVLVLSLNSLLLIVFGLFPDSLLSFSINSINS